MPGIRFTSELPVSRRAELEQVLYFNANQHRVDGPLREAVRRYGPPVMVVEQERIRFTVPHCPSVQTLYALDEPGASDAADVRPRLAAVAIYTREDVETLSVLFLAVHADYADGGPEAAKALAPQLIELLYANAARIKGIRSLRLFYHPKDLRISVRRRA